MARDVRAKRRKGRAGCHREYGTSEHKFPHAEEFLRKISAVRHAPTIRFVGHVLGRKIIKNIRLNGARNYLPAQAPTLQFLYRISTATVGCALTRYYFAVFTSPIVAFFSFTPVTCCFIYFHLKS